MKDTEKMVCVPLAAHEAALYRAEKHKKTLCAALTATSGLLLGSNAVWLILWIFTR